MEGLGAAFRFDIWKAGPLGTEMLDLSRQLRKADPGKLLMELLDQTCRPTPLNDALKLGGDEEGELLPNAATGKQGFDVLDQECESVGCFVGRAVQQLLRMGCFGRLCVREGGSQCVWPRTFGRLKERNGGLDILQDFANGLSGCGHCLSP
jgi:hypothetical protein